MVRKLGVKHEDRGACFNSRRDKQGSAQRPRNRLRGHPDFGSSPQTWAFKPVPEEQIELFKQGLVDTGIGPVFLHAIYLINLGTPIKENLEKAIDSLIKYMNLAADIGASGVIVHPGSHGGNGFEEALRQVAEAVKIVLDASPDESVLAAVSYTHLTLPTKA